MLYPYLKVLYEYARSRMEMQFIEPSQVALSEMKRPVVEHSASRRRAFRKQVAGLDQGQYSS